MNLKKMKNLVLSLVGALFLTVFLCGTNSSRVDAAGVESQAGRQIYFLASKTYYGTVGELSAADFGDALSGSRLSPRGIKVNAYYTDYVTDYNYYVKIDGFEHEETDVLNWFNSNPQPDSSEPSYMINNSFYELNESGKVVALYYEVGLTTGVKSGKLSFYSGVYVDDSSYVSDANMEQYTITFRNEVFYTDDEGIVIQRPDMTNETRVQYKDPSTGENVNYYDDNVLTNTFEAIFVNEATGAEEAGTIKYKLDASTGEKLYVIAEEGTISVVSDFSYGSGLKTLTGASCTLIEGEKFNCTYVDRTGSEQMVNSVNTPLEYVLIFRYETNLGTVFIRGLHFHFIGAPDIAIDEGLTLTTESGSVINGSYDADGNFTYSWINQTANLHINASDIYYSDESSNIKQIDYIVNGSTTTLCKTAAGSNGCNNIHIAPKTANISLGASFEGITTITFRLKLGDSDGTVVEYGAIIKMDLTAPNIPTVTYNQTPKVYDGMNYFTDANLSLTPFVSDNSSIGQDKISGLASSRLTVMRYDGSNFVAVNSAFTDILLESGVVFDFSKKASLVTNNLYKVVIASLDKAGNQSTYEYQFYMEYNYPKFALGTEVLIDPILSESFTDTETDVEYYKSIIFYVPVNKIQAGNSGIKSVEYCLIRLESATNNNPSVVNCEWKEAVYHNVTERYNGGTTGIDASGYYRVAYRVTNNIGVTVANENVVYNGLSEADTKYLCIDNTSDTIDFKQDTDDVWGNDKITLSFNITNTFSPVKTVEVIDLSDDSPVATTLNNGTYNFEVLENGEFKIVVTDLIGNQSVEEFTITGIDKVKPVLGSVTYASDYINQGIYLTEASGIVVRAYDDASGIKEMVINIYQLGTDTKIFEAHQVTTCNDDTCRSTTIYMGNSNISENGVYEIYIKITDRAGNFIEFRNHSDDNYIVENDGGKAKLNGILTEIDYTGDEIVAIGENGTWEIDGVDTEIGAVYEFNYLNGSPTVSLEYALTDGGLKYPTTNRVIYGSEELYIYVKLPDVTASMDVQYAICTSLSSCNSYQPVNDLKIVIDNPLYVNSGIVYYVKVVSSYTGTSGDVTENIASFMLDNTPDNISIVAEKQTLSTISKIVDINVVSDKNGGSDRNRILYFYSAEQLDSIDSESDFASATTVNSTNTVTATLNGYYYFFYEDKSLNQSIGFIRITVIDNVYPTVEFNPVEWNKIYQSFSTTVSIVDKSISNSGSQNSQSSMVTSFAYAWTMNPNAVFTASQLTTVTTGFESVKTTTLSKTSSSYIVDGVYYLYVYVKDYVGNEYQGVNTSYYVVIDNTVPTTDNISTTIQFQSGNSWVTADSSVIWFNSNVNVKIQATEYSFASSQYVSIIYGQYGKVVYAVAASTEIDSSYTYSSHTASRFTTYVEESGNGVVITEEGQYKIFIYALDEANNVSGQVIVYVNIDKTAPSLKNGYTSVLSSNFSHSVEKIENNSEGVASFSYESIIKNTDILNYTDNIDLAGVTYHFDGVYKDAEGTIEYISPASPAAYSREDKIIYTRNNFLKCAEDEETYYIKLVLVDRAGNEYVEFIDIEIATSVPPIITLIKTTLGCDDNLATTVLCHLNVGTSQYEIKLIYGDEDINGNRYITPESRINPKEILINIGIESFTTYINAKVEDNIDRTYHITSTTYNLDLKQEGSSAYICFTATDSSGNVVGNINACNYDTDAEFREYLIEYIYQRDKMNAADGEEPPRLTSDEVANTEEYITADQNRIKLTVGYLNGPYLSFIPFDPTNTAFDSTSSDYISNYSITYLQKSITGVTVPGFVEPGVYFADYDNIVGVHTSFATIGDLSKKIGVEIKRYVHQDTGNEKFEDTPEFILTHWSDTAYFESIEYLGGNIDIETPDEDAIYVIRYADNQHVDDSSTTRNIFRKIVYTSGVPIIDTGNYLASNVIQVEKSSTDAIPISTIVSCFVYNDAGEKDNTGCTLSWNVYDMNYKLLGSSDYSIPKNRIGSYRLIFSAIDKTEMIKAPTTEIIINIVDTTAPTISFTRDAYKYMTVEHGTIFRDAYTGIIVTDDYDSGSLNYEVSGTVDTSKLGCYTLLYSAKDSSNNIGYNQRIVCVVDTKKPVIEMKDGYVNDTTMDGQDIVNAKTYTYERSSNDAFNLRNYVNEIVVGVSDNKATLTKDNLLIEQIVPVNPTRCGKYVIKITLNDSNGYTFDFGTNDVPNSIVKSTPDNVAVEYVIIQVIDTIAPAVNVTDLNSQYIANNSIVTDVNSVLRVNLFDGEQYEYGDSITVKLNGNEISSSELNNGISTNGYYHYEFIDSSGNTTTFTFILMMASYPTIRIESSSVTFDLNNSNLLDVKAGEASIKLRKKDLVNKVTYEVGEAVVVLGYSTVSSTERYDILHTVILTESLVNLLEIDDYEFTLSGISADNVLITKLNVANTVKLGIGVNNNQQNVEKEESGGNTTIGIVAIVALVAVAGGGFVLLKKKKNKN